MPMPIPAVSDAAPSTRPLVLTKAVLRASERLGLTNGQLARVIGLSEPTVSRMKRGAYLLEDGSKPFELAALLVRLFRSLDAIAGGGETVIKGWMRSENTVLGGRPVDLIPTISGLTDAIAYLDARRAVG